MSLNNQNILLGVTGGIAAYKSADLCRQLKKLGANVRVVMTAGACEFVRPLTFQALSGEPVSTTLLDEQAEAGMGHIELAKWADCILIAPASANTIARLAHGFSDDLLSTLVLATEAPIILAPAMNQVMWSNAATQSNLERFKSLYASSTVLGPCAGEQACGDVGLGRMMEPVDIVKALSVSENGASKGLRVVITAGPTREALDPVRYLTNHSSGKMGYALAESFKAQGADVTLISGPVTLSASAEIKRIDVESAEQMYTASINQLDHGADIFIGAAAVADYKPVEQAANKIKKSGAELTLSLTQNPDIIAAVSNKVGSDCLVVGFAAETNDVLSYAQGKLRKKGLDLIIANDVSDQSIGFNSDENAVSVVSAHGIESLPKQTKQKLSDTLVQIILNEIKKKREEQ